MIFKKRTLTIAAALALASSLAFATDKTEHSISITAKVPSTAFAVTPTDPSLTSNEQKMDYSILTGTLNPIKAHFNVRNTSGGVQASLATNAKLVSGTNSIKLDVVMNGKPLSTTPATIVSKSDAAMTPDVILLITAAPVTAPATFVAGEYSGTVALVFDTVL